MATFAVQQVSIVNPPVITNNSASGGGDKFLPGANVMVALINLSGGPVTATFATQNTSIAGLAVDDLVVTVAAGAAKAVGPFPPEYFAAASDGLCAVTYSGTGLALNLFKI